MTTLQIALDCLRRGWYAFPCVPGDKVPIKGVSGYLDASNDEGKIRAWWAATPNANVGIATAKSGLIVVDMDTGLSCEDDLRAYTAAHDIPQTFAIRTGKRPEYRVQLFFSGTGAPSFNGWKHEDGFSGDVRGSTWGHVMAPGCLHPSGAHYEVLWDLPVAPVPNWARALKQATIERPALADPTAPIVEWRNDTLYRVLCKHRANGADDEMIRDFALRAVAKMPDPLDEKELERIIDNACKQPIGQPEPVAILGTGKTASVEVSDAEDADAPEKAPRPVYVLEDWEGTFYYEFAELCSRDNFIPKKFLIEGIRTVTGSIVGKQLCGTTEATQLAREYTVLIGGPGSGKGTTCERVTQLFKAVWESETTSVEPPLLFSGHEHFWRSSGIGAQIVNTASAPGLMEALRPRKLKAGEALDPREVWKPVPRFIGIQEELRGLFANFQNETAGAGLESILCELYDRDSFSSTAAKGRAPEYGELMYGLLGGMTPELWEQIFSKGCSTASGFLSRLNIMGSEEDRRVDDLALPNFTSLRNRFFPLIKDLAKHPRKLSVSPDAAVLSKKWFNGLVLAEGMAKSRLNIHAGRAALHLAWLRGHDRIEAADMEAGTRLGDYLLKSREFYAPAEGETRPARCEAAIMKVMRAMRRMPLRELRRKTHGSNYGVGMWDKAIKDLGVAGYLRTEDVGNRRKLVILLKEND